MVIRLRLVFTPAPLESDGEVVTLCTGQRCADRAQCLRYKIRRTNAEWASFDIERAAKEACPGYVDNWMRRRSMARR